MSPEEGTGTSTVRGPSSQGPERDRREPRKGPLVEPSGHDPPREVDKDTMDSGTMDERDFLCRFLSCISYPRVRRRDVSGRRRQQYGVLTRVPGGR